MPNPNRSGGRKKAEAKKKKTVRKSTKRRTR